MPNIIMGDIKKITIYKAASRMRWLGASTDLSRGYDPIATSFHFFEVFFIVA